MAYFCPKHVFLPWWLNFHTQCATSALKAYNSKRFDNCCSYWLFTFVTLHYLVPTLESSMLLWLRCYSWWENHEKATSLLFSSFGSFYLPYISAGETLSSNSIECFLFVEKELLFNFHGFFFFYVSDRCFNSFPLLREVYSNSCPKYSS